MSRFKYQVCLVTGATEGIGFAIARRMLQEGGFVHICSRKKDNVDAAVAQLKAEGLTEVHGHVCNVGVPEQRKKMLDAIRAMHCGRLDVLVPNAACLVHVGEQLAISERSYDKYWDLNVKSTFFLIKECKDMLLQSVASSTAESPKAANILVVSSIVGTNPQEKLGIYSMTKAALDNMIKFLAQELMDDGIRVNSIAPGLIKTKFSGGMWKGDGGESLSRKLGNPEHIGSVAACICSHQDGAFMNGSIYHVNGGYSKL